MVLMGVLEVLMEVLEAIAPVLILFFIFQVLVLKKIPENIRDLLSGVLMTIIGFFLFFYGAKISLIPMGSQIGTYLASVDLLWVVILIFIVGVFAILAEPAVNVFVYEVEKVSSGYVRKNILIISIALGVGMALIFSALRIYFNLPLAVILIPGYIIILCMVLISPKEFIGIAFDSGAVATGPMVVTFALPIMTSLAIGLRGGDSGILGLGTVGLVAMFPIASILMIGILLKRREKS
ncbi:MAG TPA: DUF1538 domain-containing protein [Methanobacterium subterraneum]|uniref:DUF1538 domain-containing protein n=1 Tax=Methanobacterium subterraneum TaxID=59277 RepID=A0A7J4TJZ0_9EURY|nr:DUF1538 domain-containing protein [Methanobacterium subterraneum]